MLLYNFRCQLIWRQKQTAELAFSSHFSRFLGSCPSKLQKAQKATLTPLLWMRSYESAGVTKVGRSKSCLDIASTCKVAWLTALETVSNARQGPHGTKHIVEACCEDKCHVPRLVAKPTGTGQWWSACAGNVFVLTMEDPSGKPWLVVTTDWCSCQVLSNEWSQFNGLNSTPVTKQMVYGILFAIQRLGPCPFISLATSQTWSAFDILIDMWACFPSINSA